MSTTEAVARHRAQVEETEMRLSNTRDRLCKIGRDIYEHRNWLNGCSTHSDVIARGLSAEHASRTAAVARLQTEQIAVKEKCDSLEAELKALQDKRFASNDVFEERSEAYRDAVAAWEAAKANEAQLVAQGAEVALQSAAAAAALVAAEGKQRAALSTEEAMRANDAVSDAARKKATQDTLSTNIHKALERARANKKAAAVAVRAREREMLSAKVDAALDELRHMPEFEAVRQSLELTFVAALRGELAGSYQVFLAHAFGSQDGGLAGGSQRMQALTAQNVQALGLIDIPLGEA